MATEYVKHFKLAESPFARNHDPRWLYLSTQYKEAIIKTRWTIQEYGGLALIRGDVGQGKSFLVEYLMTVWPHQHGWRCAKLQNTGTLSTPRAILAEVLMAFGLPPSKDAREMAIRFESWLLARTFENQQTCVLFIDEAQSLGNKTLPVLRDLLNLETRERILLQMILSAQPNIDEKLDSFPALQSRIASVTTLQPLPEDETIEMLCHRFKRAGCDDPYRICSPEAMSTIYLLSGGVPRDILVITESAMKEAFLQDSSMVLPEHVHRASGELVGRRPRHAKAA